MRTETKRKADRRFLIYIFILIAVGLVMLASASAPLGYTKFSDALFYLKKQIISGFFPGLALLLFFFRLGSEKMQKIGWIIYGLSFVLLILVFIPEIGKVMNGSRSWLDLGKYGSFQPSELAKLGLIAALASVLSNKNKNQYGSTSGWYAELLPPISIMAPILVLVALQPDIGTFFILSIIAFSVLFLSKISMSRFLVLGIVGVLVFSALIFSSTRGKQRIETFLNPELDPQKYGYQIKQAYLAVGSGGWWGLGLGKSRQKFQYLPEVNADSIFAVVAEEIGFVFSSLFVLLILLISARAMKLARRAPDDFSYLLVGGIAVWFAGQAFLNIGSIIGLLPLTGVPLPFVSHGGSALMTAMAAAGMVLSVSRK
ncbi:MAG: putative peptidoglycan glycosyltransferase FtsW [Patescibacteria group bacterium]|nr:putative peptidoglycan glycosyltransferase FtsW [Patescibacteria group bacterium]